MNRTICMLMVMVLAGLAGPARALDAAQLLEKIDQVEYAAEDSVAEVRVVLYESGGQKSERRMKMWQKGNERRLIRFEKPADVRGIGFLDVAGKMYVYFPAFHKVRRVAGSVKNQNFAGTDFAHSDLSSERFSKRLQAVKLEKQDKCWLLTAREKDGDSPYSRLVFRVRPDFLFDRVEYYDRAGNLWKVFERQDFRPVGKYRQSYRVSMTDKKKNHRTEMIVEKLEMDTGLKDSFFSKRRLKRF